MEALHCCIAYHLPARTQTQNRFVQYVRFKEITTLYWRASPRKVNATFRRPLNPVVLLPHLWRANPICSNYIL